MLSKALKLRITIGILLTVLLLSAASFKTQLQDAAALEVNAHLNNLMKSSHSFLLTEPAPIAGGTPLKHAKDGAFAKTNAAAYDSLDAWFDRSQTQALIIQKKGRIVYQRFRAGAGYGRHVNAMSMTKAIIAILVGIAIDDGLIDSERDSISLYLPQIVERAGAAITLRDLLWHTSGITKSTRPGFNSTGMPEAIHRTDTAYKP